MTHRTKVIITASLLFATAVAIAAPITKVYLDADRGQLVLKPGAFINNQIGVGSIGVSSTGFSLTETGDSVTHKTVFTLSDIELVITDHTTAGAHGSINLYDLPAGYVKFIGSTIDVDVECGTTGLTATATYDFGIGTITAGIDNAALATTEQNVITKMEGDLSSSAAALGSVNSTDLAVDGTSAAEDLWFNVAFEADDASAADLCTLTGTITVTWVNLGDY